MSEVATQTMQSSQELVGMLHEFYQAARTSNVSAIEAMLSRSPGVTMIGTDPAEWFTGYDEIRRVFAAQIGEMGGWALSPGETIAYADETTGWIADRPTFSVPDGEMEIRISFVVHREDGQWKIVHGHFSIGVPNEEAVGQELTI